MALVIVPNSSKMGRMDDAQTVNSLDWLQRTVGGYIESFTFREPVEVDGELYAGMIFNEEGKLLDLSINHLATLVARQGGLSLSDCIVGVAVLFKRGEID